MAVEIQGHPSATVNGQLVTLCSECGQMRTILFLTRDRWICTRCRAEGAAPPNLYPIA